MERLLIKIPSRERPEQLLKVLLAYSELIEDKDRTQVLVSVDDDDRSMDGFFHRFKNIDLGILLVSGQRSTKVGAVNRDVMDAPPWDVVLVGSDDMMPVAKGLDRIIMDSMRAHHPDGDGCLWFSDARQERVCTYPVMGRTWYKRHGHIYHPGYDSYYADDEQTEVAVAAGRMVRDGRVILRHDHACWPGGLPNDGLYDHNRQAKLKDRATYQHRKQHGFPA